MAKGKIIIIVAPSGTGKSTLLKMLFEEFPILNWSVSTTTRPMREGEVDGKDYNFISVEEFKKGIESDDFVEWAEVHSNYYGTSKTFISQMLEAGKLVVCDLDVKGTDNMLKTYPEDAEAIFIEPPSLEILRKRLRGRATDDTNIIELRLNNAEQELKRKDDYDHLVKNEELEQAYRDLKNVFVGIMKRHGVKVD